MRFCKYCGYQISENVKICQRCGKNIEKRNENKNVNKKRIAIIGIMVAVVIMIVCVINIGRCDAKKCNNKAISGMHYCYAHKCVINNCDNEKSSYSNYCYSHYLIYDDDAVSSEGLAPGESCTWRMSVKKNHNIDECVVSILDFDY